VSDGNSNSGLEERLSHEENVGKKTPKRVREEKMKSSEHYSLGFRIATCKNLKSGNSLG